jgi:hypothetical protein
MIRIVQKRACRYKLGSLHAILAEAGPVALLSISLFRLPALKRLVIVQGMSTPDARLSGPVRKRASLKP